NREERPVHLDEREEVLVEPLEQLHVIGEIDEAGAQERPDERYHREQEDQPLLIQLAPRVAGKDHEPRPAPREGSRVSRISPLVDRHYVTSGRRRASGLPRACVPGGPSPSGRSPPTYPGGA